MTARWQFWIDRGGTFTDCLGVDPGGQIHITKVLSSDDAPLIAIRQLLAIDEREPVPPCDVRMGTTLATNALLERRGEPCVLAITRGLGDLLIIGDQTRPELFALDVVRPAPLTDQVVEIDVRLGPDGACLDRASDSDLREALARARRKGRRSMAVCVLHSYRDPAVEAEVAQLARDAGFDYVIESCRVTGEQGILARARTAVLDAYLTPALHRYLDRLRDRLPGSQLRLMQSSGALIDAGGLRGPNAILSGPAGGLVAAAKVAKQAGHARAVTFDMGGTSTDVACIDGGVPDRVHEIEVAGITIRAPTLDVHTVAAGGGSLCRLHHGRVTVGPDSAGADPGPVCYGADQPGRADWERITITDVNLALGRLVGDRFPFALDEGRARAALDQLHRRDGGPGSSDRLAWGFIRVANESMAEAIRQVSIARGRDPRDFALVVFGGAGGQHACAVARALGIRTVVCHPRAGVLSAWGMGLADEAWHGTADAGRRRLVDDLIERLEPELSRLEQQGRQVLGTKPGDDIRVRRMIDLRYRGTDTSLTVSATGDLAAQFRAAHQRWFGYTRPDHPIEATTVRVEVRRVRPDDDECDSAVEPPASAPVPRRRHRLYADGDWHDCALYHREDLAAGHTVIGPALVLDATSTTVVDPGFVLEAAASGALVLRDTGATVAPDPGDRAVDPVRLEIFANAFMSIARQMGAVLERTALSTNIRERRDFSCAVFDPDGGLVANAPHIPVHLGAMGESVRAILAAHPEPEPGSAFVTNDPAGGGSHLPDITVVTPIHDECGRLRFFTASRGHHADVGGITPGSMPPDATTLAEEGVVLRAVQLVRGGVFDEPGIRKLLERGPHPARTPGENLADLEAQLAANRTGARLLAELCQRHGDEVVQAYLGHLQDNAAASVASEIARMADGRYAFTDQLDDGSVIAADITIDGEHMVIDLGGCGPEHAGNLNAPRAVSIAAILYVLRCLIGADIPLNSGCLRPVTVRWPRASIVSPGPTRAVSGGNVETSQRLVDVLLAALGRAAASQGTMNNLTLGNEHFGYYETLGGGTGATRRSPGASAVHSHMTNTRLTDAEVLESRYPLRLVRLAVRRGSGGAGMHPGGDGLIRELEALAPLSMSIVSERRQRAPFGLASGRPGSVGHNWLNDTELPGRARADLQVGDVIRIETPGGGGYGPAESQPSPSPRRAERR